MVDEYVVVNQEETGLSSAASVNQPQYKHHYQNDNDNGGVETSLEDPANQIA